MPGQDAGVTTPCHRPLGSYLPTRRLLKRLATGQRGIVPEQLRANCAGPLLVRLAFVDETLP